MGVALPLVNTLGDEMDIYKLVAPHAHAAPVDSEKPTRRLS